MVTRIFAFFALAAALCGTQCWAQESNTCSGGEELSCTNFFSPGVTTGTYDFGNDGQLTVQFDTVLTSFSLTVTVDHQTDPIDFNAFPAGTACVIYQFNGNHCAEYDFTGNKGGPNGVPVKNVDYKRLITLTLSYVSDPLLVHTPAFGHAPGDNSTAVYNEDILTAYSTFPIAGDPTMKGTTPGLSSVAALDEPFTESGDSFCSLTLQTPPFFVGQVIEVQYRLKNGADCSKGIRDKTAQFSLALTSSGNVISFPPLRDKEEGNKFHWDNKSTTNEFDLSTVGLPPGHYTITVFSGKVSPQSVDFDLAPAP